MNKPELFIFGGLVLLGLILFLIWIYLEAKNKRDKIIFKGHMELLDEYLKAACDAAANGDEKRFDYFIRKHQEEMDNFKL